MAFDKDTYCSFCYMPGAKHEGGAEINGKHVSGVFCKKECFDKWLRWKNALLSDPEGPTTGQGAGVCPTCQKKEDPEKEAAPVGDA